jgi:hypothetical protein
MSTATSRAPKPGQERPVEKFEEVYPYMRPRDAATLILVRMKGRTPEVLMGCRAAKSAFMPNRYVSPAAGSTGPMRHIPIATPLDRHVKARLLKAATALRAQALGVRGGARDLRGDRPDARQAAQGRRAEEGLRRALEGLPRPGPGAGARQPRPDRPRGNAARPAAPLQCALLHGARRGCDGEIRHSSEMGDVRWVKLDEARELPLPTITGLILGEIGRLVKEPPDRKKQRRIPLFVTVHRKHLMIEE